MKDTKKVLSGFLEKAAKEKTITDTEIIDELADIPDVDFDEVYSRLSEAGVQITTGDEAGMDDILKEADSPVDDWDGGSMDSLHMYLHEIRQYPLLTLDEERKLSKTMVDGREAQAVLDEGRALPDEELAELKALVKAGDKAKQKLIESNLRFVVYLARPYQTQDMHLLDLIQCGNMGLMRGIERYDPSKGYRLTTYAGWWVKQAITRDIANNGRAIRLPVHMSEKARKVRAAENKFLSNGITDYTDEELAAAADISVEALRDLRVVCQDAVSLDVPVGDEDGDMTLIDMLADNSERPEEAMENQALHDALLNVMEDILSDKERLVIVMRMGLDGEPAQTLEQVGNYLHVTRERVRQIERNALRKMRIHRKRVAYLDFVDPQVLEEALYG